MKKFLVVIGVLALLGGLMPLHAASTVSSYTEEELLAQGCHTDWAATTYTAGTKSSSAVAPPAGSKAPVPCLSLTGYGSSDAGIGITPNGTVVFAPAYTEEGPGVLWSHDNGATWDHLSIPVLPNGGVHTRVNNYLNVDPATGRVFFLSDVMKSLSVIDPTNWPGLIGTVIKAMGVDINVGGFNVTSTSNEGATWTYNKIGTDGLDWSKTFAGPPISKGPKPVGYPNVVYFINPAPLAEPVPPVVWPNHQSIFRSLDGGVTWTKVSQLDITQLGNSVPVWEYVIYGQGVVGPDGSVYLPYRRGPHLAVAISRDEGKTWTKRDIPGMNLVAMTSMIQLGLDMLSWNCLAAEPLAIDAAGNIYAVNPNNKGQVFMSVSKDKGVTWSTPVVVSAPGVSVYFSAVAAKGNGTVAIAYYGSKDGINYTGYIAESTNALASKPLFWSAAVTNPANPLFPTLFSTGWIGMFLGEDVNELIQVKYAPNGDIWTAFLKEMCDGEGSIDVLVTCRDGWDYCGKANSRYQGAAGRLVHR